MSDSWLERAAALRPDRLAVEAPDGARTYRELLEAARAGAGAWAHERLARFKVPKEIELADGLPRTPSGKLLRRELA